MKTIYQVHLTPLERFFFGSEKTFGKNNQDSYFVRSRYYPQQTTILGMLRYLLLFQNDLMDKTGKVSNEDAANQLIGKSGFSPVSDTNYGKILSISPIFIDGSDGTYLTLSREYAVQPWKDLYSLRTQLSVFPLHFEWVKHETIYSPLLRGITPKSIFPDLLINERNGTIRPLQPMEGLSKTIGSPVFQNEMQVGITKKEKHEEDEAGFYKQEGLWMNRGFSYMFYLELEKEDSFVLQDADVPMGSDQSWFHFECKKCVDTIDKLSLQKLVFNHAQDVFKQNNPLSSKMVLLSDVWLPLDSYKTIFPSERVFSSCDTLTFRYIESLNEKQKRDRDNFYLANNSIRLRKSILTKVLLKRGGVFYFQSSEEKAKAMNLLQKESSAFYKIGYNYAI
jgi:CRISPR-associated protein Cmr3